MPRPKIGLTPDQQRLVRAKALADRGFGFVRAAIDECYRICLPHFDEKRRRLSDELTDFLRRQGFRNLNGRNWALAPVGYVLSGGIDKDRKRHEANLVAASVEMHRMTPSDAIHLYRGRQAAIDLWLHKTGGYGNKKKHGPPPAPAKFELARGSPDEPREMPLTDVPSGLSIALETIDIATMEVVVHNAFGVDDPRPIVRAIFELMRKLPKLDETGNNTPTPLRYAAPLIAELRGLYGPLSGIDPCAGLSKIFFNLMDEPKLFCERQFGLDILDYKGPRLKWGITNPPWSKIVLLRIARKLFETCDNVALLIKIDPILIEPLVQLATEMGYGFRTELRIQERYHTGKRTLGGSMGGMPVTMFHWMLGYAGAPSILDLKLPAE